MLRTLRTVSGLAAFALVLSTTRPASAGPNDAPRAGGAGEQRTPVIGGQPPAGAPEGAVDSDTPDPNDPVDMLSILTSMPRKKGRRVMRELRLLESDLPTAIAAVRRREADGSEDLYIAYEVSLYNRCVFEQRPAGREATRRAREACANSRGILTKLAHVRVAPTPGRRAQDTGGAIAMVAHVDLGVRSANRSRDSSQTFFDGMGLVDAAPRSELRIWVAFTEVEFELVNDSRGEDINEYWVGMGEQKFVILDTELAEDFEGTLVEGDLDGAVGVPTVEYEARARTLVVRSGERTIRLVYSPSDDSFSPAS